MDSPAPSIMDLTPSHPRRSSSLASRKATQEPESNLYQLSRSAYSLPPTPVASSFEDALPSTKRRKRRGSINYNEKTPQSTYFTASSNVDTSAGLSEAPSRVSKRNRSRKRDILSGDPTSTPVSDVSRATTPASSSHVKLKAQPEQSHSTLQTFLSKQPRDSGVAEAVRSGLADSVESLSDSKESTAGSTTSSKRRSRRSTPAKANAARSVKSENRSQASTPRSGTPQPSLKDWAPKNVSQSSMRSTPASTRQSTPAAVSVSRLAKTNAMDHSKSATPSARSGVSTPDNRSSVRSRRSRKTTTAATSTPVSEHEGEKHNPESASKSGLKAEPADKRRKSNTITLTLSRKALESVLPKPVDQLPYGPKIADSVEATPSHLYDGGFHFEYDTEMYRNNFGLDGQMDTPASPTSFSTTTSAARISSRARKPTIRALESFESEKKFRRNRTKTPKPSGEGVPPMNCSEQTTRFPPATTPTQRTPAPQPIQKCTADELAARLFELASTAVSPDFTPPNEAETWLEELRNEYCQRTDTKGARTPVGKDAGDSRGTSQFNDFGEELLGVPDGYTWVRPDNTYGDDALPQPPVRLKSCEQIEKDRIYGFPPRIGARNLPREVHSPFVVEDVHGETAKIKAREDARRKGVVIDRSMSLPEIEALVAQHSSSSTPKPLDTPKEVKEPEEPKEAKGSDAKPKETRKRRRTDPVVKEQASNGSAQDTPATRTKRRRKDITRTTASTPASRTPTSRRTAASKSKPATMPGTDNEPAAGVKAENGTGPSSGSASNSVTPNDASAPTRRRRRKKKGVILRILGPKGDPSDDRHRQQQESKKRSFSEVERSSDGMTEQRTPKSSKISEAPTWSPKIKLKKPSLEKNRHRPVESKANGAAIRSTPETPSTVPETPSTIGNSLNETPDGRPRRAAAAAMIAGSKHDAEKRARKFKARGRKSTGGKKPVDTGKPAIREPAEPPQTE